MLEKVVNGVISGKIKSLDTVELSDEEDEDLDIEARKLRRLRLDRLIGRRWLRLGLCLGLRGNQRKDRGRELGEGHGSRRRRRPSA